MGIYAIADLHLSFASNKPMDVFGVNWVDHAGQIQENWLRQITASDLVLIPGDISWALHLSEAETDLLWLSALPGIKVILRGNHDYWWVTLKKMRQAYPGLNFLQNDAFVYEDYAICGTRGWLCPGEQGFNEDQDQKIYQRELIRLRLSLDEAKKTGKRIIAMIHYPPFTVKQEATGFTELFQEYAVELVLYGHIHNQFDSVFEGIRGGVEYRLVSSDYLKFNPLGIRE